LSDISSSEGNRINYLRIQTLLISAILLSSCGFLIPSNVSGTSTTATTVNLTLDYMERNEHFGDFGFDIFTEWHEIEVVTTTDTYLVDPLFEDHFPARGFCLDQQSNIGHPIYSD